ncbi:MAG: hypothetical protein DRO99_05030, partial [Candidatus Aenigmatarchaeota archaeon]
MNDAMQDIKKYVLDPDYRGGHLRQMVDQMAKSEWQSDSREFDGTYWDNVREFYASRAAETVARFIYLVWDSAGPEEYGPRTFEMLRALQDRMPKNVNWDTWGGYAVPVLNSEIRSRLEKASEITIDPEMETAMVHHFFDEIEEYGYLHDVRHCIEHLHWERKHSPSAPTADEYSATGKPVGERGDDAVETHLRRTAMEGLATHIEQSNIARGNIMVPT